MGKWSLWRNPKIAISCRRRPESPSDGFFCPSDSKQDFKVKIQPNAENRQVVFTQGLKAGLWKIKVDWKGDGKAYYKEEVIVI